jgi:hypothetical protein
MAAPLTLRQSVLFMSKSSPQTDPSFEDAMQRLDEIVAGMEDSQLSLEDMISQLRGRRASAEALPPAHRRCPPPGGAHLRDLDSGKATTSSL